MEDWLVLALQPELVLATTGELAAEFELGGVRYSAVSPSSMAATFDRLKDTAGRFVGLQVWPLRAYVGDLLDQLPRQRYLFFPEDVPCFQVFFSGAVDEEAESLGEQALGARVFRGATAEFAVALEIVNLIGSDYADQATVYRASGRWMPIVALSTSPPVPG
jgi:hypothetical protein